MNASSRGFEPGSHMLRPAVLVHLLAAATAYSSFLQTFRFPHTPAGSGLQYIHSPEFFLRTHGLCGPDFSLVCTQPPVQCGDHAYTVMTYRTLLDGTMHARLFTNDGNRSHFMLMDGEHRPCVMGHLRVLRLGRSGGFMLRCFASRMRPAGFWNLLLGSSTPSQEYVESMVHACCHAMHEDANLRRYRRMAIGLPGPKDPDV